MAPDRGGRESEDTISKPTFDSERSETDQSAPEALQNTLNRAETEQRDRELSQTAFKLGFRIFELILFIVAIVIFAIGLTNPFISISTAAYLLTGIGVLEFVRGTILDIDLLIDEFNNRV